MSTSLEVPESLMLHRITADTAELVFETIDSCRSSQSIREDFSEMFDAYSSLAATQERIAARYDSSRPNRHGYVATTSIDGKPTGVGVGYLGLGEVAIQRWDESTEEFLGINFSVWVHDDFRRCGVARRLLTQVLSDVPHVQRNHPDWADGRVWTGIRPENHKSRGLTTSLGFMSVGIKIADPQYVVYL